MKPATIMAGMTPAWIQTAIRAPMRMKIKMGMMATLTPSLMPLFTSSQEKPRSLAQRMIRAVVVSTGTCGARLKPMTLIPSTANMPSRTKLASRTLTFLAGIVFLL